MNNLPYSQLIDDRDRIFDILVCDQHTVVIRNKKTMEIQTYTRDEFKVALTSFLMPVQPETPHSILTPQQEKIMKKRAPYLETMKQIFEEEHLHMTTMPVYDRVVAEVEEKLTLNSQLGSVVRIEHPKPKTLSKWWKSYRDSGFSFIDSLPSRKSRRNTTDPRSEKIVIDCYERFMMGKIIPSIASGYAKYVNWANELNDPNITIVSYEKFRRHHHSFNELERAIASGNKAEINKLMRSYRRRIKVERVLERVEVDRLALNLCLIDNSTGEVLGKVALYIAIDCHSRYPLAVTVEFGEPEKAMGAVNLLRNILLRSSIKLNAFGIPFKIVGDNGPGFNNEIFSKTAEAMCCELVYAPSNQPFKKPFVESFNNTMRAEFLESAVFKVGNKVVHGVPGYKGKRFEGKNSNKNPSDETLKQSATLTVDSFIENLHDYLVHYVNQPHSELKGKTPQEVWDASCREFPLVPCDYEDMKTIFHIFPGETTLNSTGKFRFNKQDFFGEGVQAIFWQLKSQIGQHKNPKVKVLHDPQDARALTLATTLPGDSHVTKVAAYNIDLDEESEPISFEVANMDHKTLIRRSIFHGEADLIKRKRRRVSNGKKNQSMEQNHNEKLSPSEIIQSSNDTVHERKSNVKDPLQGTKIDSPRQEGMAYRNKEGYKKW